MVSDWLNQCHFGDVRTVLRRMIADGVQVQTVVTSPPYWGLRDYGCAGQIGLEPTIGEFIGTQTASIRLLAPRTPRPQKPPGLGANPAREGAG